MTTADFPSTVNLILPAESAQTVVMFLISNKISFRLIASDAWPCVPAESESQIQPETVHHIPEGGETSKNAVIETIYRKYMEENIEQSPPVDAFIIQEFGLTATSFKNGFKAVYGKPFSQVYMEKRMEYAACLLRMGIRAAQVSKRIGYSQPIKFNKIFQKHFGMTPKKYQMSQNS